MTVCIGAHEIGLDFVALEITRHHSPGQIGEWQCGQGGRGDREPTSLTGDQGQGYHRVFRMGRIELPAGGEIGGLRAMGEFDDCAILPDGCRPKTFRLPGDIQRHRSSRVRPARNWPELGVSVEATAIGS